MKLLLDTHLLLWTAGAPERRSAQARSLIENQRNQLIFSAASVWEVAIKRALDRPGFRTDPKALRSQLLDHGYIELAISGEHALAVLELPRIHQDPFDRMLVAQAMVERLTLLTTDTRLAKYPGPVRLV